MALLADPNTPPPRLSRRDIVALAALLALVLAFFWKMAFTDLILPRGDAFTYFYPYWAARSAALRVLRLPLWNPDLFMGAPFLANSQAGVFYPLNWPLSWLSAPAAVKAAAVLHAALAAAGMYLFARRGLRLTILGATLAAAIFALGGYYTSQVEHINQFQGLAWLPWLFWLWGEATSGRPWLSLLVGGGFALQLLAGHTQTVFVSGVALGVWALWHTIGLWRRGERGWRALAWPLGTVALGALVSGLLAAAQLLPTFELAGFSPRSGGLPFSEAVSFSLHPALAGRALLPVHSGEPLFSEYVAHVGVAGLVLALTGAWAGRSNRQVAGLALLAAAGLLLALGAYNPLYWGLVRLPGFSLFRVPARWLALYALGTAGLAGSGLDALAVHLHPVRLRQLALPAGVVVVLALTTALTPLAGSDVPGAVRPGLDEIAGWAAALLLTAGGMAWLGRVGNPARARLLPALAAAAIVELFIAGRAQPYNRLSAETAWSSQRPSISTLLAATSGDEARPRFLSLSDITFDPGDLHELEAVYGPHLGGDELYDLIVASKLKEVLSPNLSMAWGLPSVDGFDGGLLPTRDYVRFTSLFTGGEAAVDGRLREYLDAVPPLDWLRLAGVRYVITDKVGDFWHGDVYYDLTFPYALGSAADPAAPLVARPTRPFTATGVGIIGTVEGADPGAEAARLRIIPAGGGEPFELPLVLGEAFESNGERNHALVEWGEPVRVEQVEIAPAEGFAGAVIVQGASLVDTRSGAYVSTSLSPGGAVRVIHSGDVKVYEITDAPPRAELICDPEFVSSDDAAFAQLAESPREPVIVGQGPAGTTGCDSAEPGTLEVLRYRPERVDIRVDVADAGVYLLLRDQWYPGWEVTVDGEAAGAPLKANGVFRAVPVPEGQHLITFTYRSEPALTGMLVSGVSVVGLLFSLRRWRRAGPAHTSGAP